MTKPSATDEASAHLACGRGLNEKKFCEFIRQPIILENRCVVELNSGDEYSIELSNDADHDVYVALYVDGMIAKNQQLLEPDALKMPDLWILGSGKRGSIKGWHNIPRDASGRAVGTASYRAFRIVERAESVASGQSFEESIGMITAIFFTVGIDNIGQPTTRSLMPLPKSVLGTGAGGRVDEKLQSAMGKPRGLMLAASTIYYRSREQIRQIQSGNSDDIVFNADGKSNGDELLKKDSADAAGGSSNGEDGSELSADGFEIK